MLSETTLKGFLDELVKIADVNLSGLSPQTVLSQKPPPPMETPGSKKAIEILDLAASMKQASVLSPALQLKASQKLGQPVLNRAKGGPAIKQQIKGSLIGLKGALPPA